MPMLKHAILKNLNLMIYVGMIVPIIIIEYSQIKGPVQKMSRERISFMIRLIIYIINVIQLVKHAMQKEAKHIIIANNVLKNTYSLIQFKINMP